MAVIDITRVPLHQQSNREIYKGNQQDIHSKTQHDANRVQISWDMQQISECIFLSSTWCKFDLDTANVVGISVSLGLRQKPSDKALLLAITFTTFKCIVSASVTDGVLVCFVVTVQWWRHRTHHDVTEA